MHVFLAVFAAQAKRAVLSVATLRRAEVIVVDSDDPDFECFEKCLDMLETLSWV